MSKLTRYEKKVKRTTEKALSIYNVTQRILPNVSEKELFAILTKVKKARIKENFFDIMKKEYPNEYNNEKDIAFFDKYKGQIKYVHKWMGDWWICEDDNYPLTEDCFEYLEYVG